MLINHCDHLSPLYFSIFLNLFNQSNLNDNLSDRLDGVLESLFLEVLNQG